MRRILPVLLLLILLTSPALAEGDNLLLNGDVAEVNASGYPTNWYRGMWFTDAGVSALTVEKGADGACLCVTNLSANDARWAQDVAVEPNTLYRITALVRAEGIPSDGYGANLSVGNTFAYSDMLYDTAGEWVKLSLTGRTGADQTALSVFARIGGYGDENLNTGRAWFDDLTLVRLDDAEAGDVAYDFSDYNSGSSDIDLGGEAEETEPARHTEAFLLLAFGYLLAVVAFARKTRHPLLSGGKRIPRMLAGALALALIARLILAARVRGYNTDINCFEAWSERMASVGPFNFYAEGYFCDYPPGYMLLLAPVAILRALSGFAYNSAAHVLLIKLIPIFCDLLGALVVYRFAQKRLGMRPALLLAVFYAFNPAVIVDSAAWGQIDSVLTLLVVVCALEAVEGRYVRSLCAFAAAALVKPQALLFAPVGLAAIFMDLWRLRVETDGGVAFRRALKRALLGVAAALGVLYLVSLPFCLGNAAGFFDVLVRPFFWLWEKFFHAMQGYRYMTVNTLNLYAVLGLNWITLDKAGVWPMVAWALFVFAYVYAIALLSASKSVGKIFLTGGLLIVLICAFGPMMHERYVYPAVLLLVLAYAESHDRRVLFSAIALTVTLFFNETLVLQGGMTELNYGHLSSSEEWLNTALSLVNVLNALYLGWVAFDLCVRGRVRTLSQPRPRPRPAPEKDFRLRLRRVDALLMAAVTLAYAMVAFANLGDAEAPQTEWVSAAPGEEVVFDLGEERDFIFTYYGGICTTAFSLCFSDDGLTWSKPVAAVYNQGEIFRWLWLHKDGTTEHARYVRLISDATGLKLREVGFLDKNGAPYPIVSATSTGDYPDGALRADPALLTDEQNTVPACPSYLNSTYFDEIYHARTAYEYLNGLETYEWTHPPLGKALMMVGIQLFGMTPFGWRFMGTLVGVLMLPMLYLMVKQLTKRTDLSFVAMFLLAVDSMHFTQTRIATIDSYAVFFIMTMYFFMFRFSQMRWKRDGFARSLVPLGLSGLFMGVAWATKWIGIYGSVGLVVIFFWTLWKNFRDWRGEALLDRNAGFFVLLWVGLLLALGACAATVLDRAGLLSLGTSFFVRALRQVAAYWKILAILGLLITAAELTLLWRGDRVGFWKRLGTVSAFCVLMFVVVPVLIYYFSYYWHMAYEGGLTIPRVVNLQKRIFDYHAGLGGDTHYFRSEWYEWPVIAWPMWYYSGTNYMPAGVISSISCMGNPAVWWFGLAAILFVAARSAWTRRASRDFVLVLVAFLSQYLPWVLVPRSTFIYHYFASVPFIIMASALLLDRLRAPAADAAPAEGPFPLQDADDAPRLPDARGNRAFVGACAALCGFALLLFIAFYPLESGTPVSRAYAMLLRWFRWYNF